MGAMASKAPEAHPTDERTGARVRRSPKYGVFLTLGAVLGILVAAILTFAFDGTREQAAANGAVYTPMQVFGFLALIGIALGLLLFGGLALLLDRTVGRRTHEVAVEHETILTSPEKAPQGEPAEGDAAEGDVPQTRVSPPNETL